MSKSSNSLDFASLFPLGESGDEQLEYYLIRVMSECFQLWQERHRKYGRSNIAKFGELGVLIRASDKMERLINGVFHRHGRDAKDETMEDSWKDLVNYAVMALLCRRGQWPIA